MGRAPSPGTFTPVRSIERKAAGGAHFGTEQGQTVFHAHLLPVDTLAGVPFAVQTWTALKEGAEFCNNSTTPNTIPSLHGHHLASSPLKTPTPSHSSRPFRRRGLLVARTEPLPPDPFGAMPWPTAICSCWQAQPVAHGRGRLWHELRVLQPATFASASRCTSRG